MGAVSPLAAITGKSLRFRVIRLWLSAAPGAAMAAAGAGCVSLMLHAANPNLAHSGQAIVALGYILLGMALFVDRPFQRNRKTLFLAGTVILACSLWILLTSPPIQGLLIATPLASIPEWIGQPPRSEQTGTVVLFLLACAVALKYLQHPILAQIMSLPAIFPPVLTATHFLCGISPPGDGIDAAILISNILCAIAVLGRTAHRPPLRSFLVASPLGSSLRWLIFLQLTACISLLLWSQPADDFTDLGARAARIAAIMIIALLMIAGIASRRLYRLGPSIEPSTIEARLTKGLFGACRRGEIRLLFQPQVDIADHRMTGVEVLVRWNHPELGLLSPIEFIPLAERSGAIRELGAWVLREACLHAMTWRHPILADIKVAVNVSAIQLDDSSFADMVEAVLRETGFPAGRLVVEVTESSVMHKGDRALKTLAALKELGSLVAIDDFGTGYSSLSYLLILPADYLKIDKSFIQALPGDPDSGAITRSIIALGHTLGLRTLAEGVETEEQEQFLQASWCDESQGFLYAKPLLENELHLWADNHAAELAKRRGLQMRARGHR